jgi:hypothetical protein
MPKAGFELAIPATKQPQTYALDRAATGFDSKVLYCTGNRQNGLKETTETSMTQLGGSGDVIPEQSTSECKSATLPLDQTS